jgi:hypothetical protein
MYQIIRADMKKKIIAKQLISMCITQYLSFFTSNEAEGSATIDILLCCVRPKKKYLNSAAYTQQKTKKLP